MHFNITLVIRVTYYYILEKTLIRQSYFMLLLRQIPILLISITLLACSPLPKNDSTTSISLEKPEHSNIKLQLTPESCYHQSSASLDCIFLLQNGINAYRARLYLIEQAKQEINVQYYLYNSDLTGHLFTVKLWEAANRGIRVRILLDDIGMAGKDKVLSALSTHDNIEVKLFNPFNRNEFRATQLVTQFGSVTRRMHNKSFTVDNTVTILGGRNIGDVYFDADKNITFNDLDVALLGPSVQKVSTSFDEYWNDQLAYPIEALADYNWNEVNPEKIATLFELSIETSKEYEYVHRLLSTSFTEQLHTAQYTAHLGNVSILADRPVKAVKPRDRREFHLSPQLAPFLDTVKNELLIVSPYFVPEQEDIEYFASLIKQGVKVKILTNSLKSNDVPVVHAGYSKYRKLLLKMGVSLFELNSQYLQEVSSQRSAQPKFSLHSKYFVIDRHTAFIGTMNLDPRSINENTEIGAMIKSKSLSEELASSFDYQIQNMAFRLLIEDGEISWVKPNAIEEVFTVDPYSNVWERTILDVISILPGESQL
ncbi:phospholipase D family protein [Vibrio rotiferianus]|uniref:phospholipase D family protein n=1 Tax=Vibrio rotiferianus TaxID=190895 RepID=UPI00406A54AC